MVSSERSPLEELRAPLVRKLKEMTCSIAEVLFDVDTKSVARSIEPFEYVFKPRILAPFGRYMRYGGGLLRGTTEKITFISKNDEDELLRICRKALHIPSLLKENELAEVLLSFPVEDAIEETYWALQIIFEEANYTKRARAFREMPAFSKIYEILGRRIHPYDLDAIEVICIALCERNHYVEENIVPMKVVQRATGLWAELLRSVYDFWNEIAPEDLQDLLRNYCECVMPEDRTIFRWIYDEEDPYDAVLRLIVIRLLAKMGRIMDRVRKLRSMK